MRKSFSLVIEPGIGFNNNKIFNLKLNHFKNKKNLSYLNNFSYEAHSSDFQNLNILKKLVKNNFKFLKVGPELTFFYMKAILHMNKIESKNKFKKNSNIKKNISLEMDKEKKYWVNYYSGSKKRIEYLKFNSFLDRSRYYFSNKKYNKIIKIIKKKILILLIKKNF